MNPEILTETAVTKEEALAVIAEIRQRVAAMGANDSEFYLLDQVVDKLNKGEIEPDEAIKAAHSILNGKQDYH